MYYAFMFFFILTRTCTIVQSILFFTFVINTVPITRIYIYIFFHVFEILA